MRAIIIAAGSGKRINKTIKDLPKALINVNGRPIIDYQIEVLKKAGISDIVIITGPHGDKFDLTGVRYAKDQNYNEHDILGSLMEAREFVKNEVLILYSDIIFDIDIIRQVLAASGDIVIAVDMDWEKAYAGRTEHPKSEAENILLDGSNTIIKIRKNIHDDNGAVGEFLGIIRLSAVGSEVFIKKYDELINNHQGKFQQAPSVPKAYLTDMIQELIDSNIEVKPAFVSSKWCEIDTMQDLKNAEKIFND